MPNSAPQRSYAAGRTAYLVLGMHRSGTSATGQLLSLAGCALPRAAMPGDESNAQGYFEPWRIANLNNERLRAAGSAWDDVFAFPPPAAATDPAKWRERAISLFEEEYVGRDQLLVKEPRMTVLLPSWREIFTRLNVRLLCVIPVRHPLAVAASLARRDGFPPEKSVLLWSAYMLAAEAYTRDLPRVFVDYDRMLTDWRAEVARIERAHGAPLPRLDGDAEQAIDAALKSDLRHNHADGDLAALGWTGELTRKVFDSLSAATRDEPIATEALDAAATAIEARRREIGPLVSSAARDLDQARIDNLAAQQSLDWERREHQALKARFEALHRDFVQQKDVLDEVDRTLEDILAGGGSITR